MEIKTVKTDKFTMDYLTFGTGERAFVILPGVSVKSVMLSAVAVAAAYAAFCERYTVYLFDRKRDIAPGYDVIAMAEDTAAVMRSLGIAHADILGTSQGGMMAQVIAARYPGLVNKLVLGSTLARQNEVSLDTFADWVRLAAAGDPTPLNRHINDRVYSDEYKETYKQAFVAMETQGTPAEIARFGVLAEACRTFSFETELKNITCPTLVIGSRKDRVLSGQGSVEIAEALGCELYMYDGYSHAVYDEAPDYKERMLGFLES